MGFTAAQLATGADEPYWQSLIDGDVVKLPRCEGCGKWHWPAVWRCGSCGSWDMEWLDVALEGTVFTFTQTAHAFPGLEALGPGFISLVVALDHPQGLRLMGILEGDDQTITIGDKVRGSIGQTEFNGETYPALRWIKG